MRSWWIPPASPPDADMAQALAGQGSRGRSSRPIVEKCKELLERGRMGKETRGSIHKSKHRGSSASGVAGEKRRGRGGLEDEDGVECD